MSELFNAHGWKITLDSASLPDGREEKMVRVHRCDAVHIIPISSEGNIVMIREFRPFYGTYIWMIPSGKVDKEHDIEEAAQRELREETGYFAKDLKHYCTTHFSEAIDKANHIFIARDLHHDPLPQDECELIEVHEVPLEEAIENVLGSEYVHTTSAYALLRYARENP